MEKLRSSLLCSSSCCFRGADVDPLTLEHHHHLRNLPEETPSPSSLVRSPTASDLPDKSKRRGVVSRLGIRNHHHHHRRRRGYSADFRYDPLSYSLNFDDGPNPDAGGDPSSPAVYRNFSTRLPRSPPPATTGEKEGVII